MKKFFSLLIAVVMVFTVMAPAFTASAEDLMSASVTDNVKVETQADNSSGGFFQAIIDFFRSLFYSRITFDTDGGSEIDDYYKLKLSRITPPADPTKEGYTFTGWEPEIPAKMPWGNLTVKAIWDTNSHNVYWVIDGETVKTETYSYGSVISSFVPEAKEGYTFSGWYFIPETMPDSDVTISGSYTKDTEIVVTESDEEFNNKVMELVNQSLNDENFDKEEALEDEFYMSRVVANCSDFSMIDFSMFEADTIVMNDDGTVVLQFANRDLAEECSDYLNGLSSVTFAEADAYVEAPEEVEIESIPSISNSIWGEKYINADKYSYYLENNNFDDLITVAVIDTGIDMDHPYFNGRLVSGKNVLTRTSNVEDDNGHGSHVSGIVVNCTNNLNVKIMPIKILGENGGSFYAVAEGINHAASQNVDVINLSIEASDNHPDSFLVENAINNAVKKGITVVVAAGNGDKTTRLPADTVNITPAKYDNVIVVGALDDTGTKASFSNYGDSVDVIAPGVKIPSAYKEGGYRTSSGTSQAAPHIAAVAAMFKLAYPSYTPAQIEALIKQYCVDKGPSGRDDFYGEGCPDMYDAIPDCTVSFDSNGGTSVSSATTKNSSSVTLPTPSKSYKVTFNANGGSLSTSYITSKCSFDGWYTTSSLTGQKYSGGESYMLLDDQTMYAKWTNNASTVANYTPTRSGYKFDGWYTAASGGTQYTNATTITGNVTVYAHWSQRSITYYANGGSGAPSTQYGYGNTTLSSTKPTRSGYQFLGWSERNDATSAGYNSGAKISLYENIKLYAVWGKITVSITGNPATSGEQNMTCTNAYKVTKYTTYPGKVTSGTFYGYRFKLPSVSYQYIPSGSVCGWEIVSGNAVVNGDYMYISQPGTVKYRYRCGDYYSETLSYTLKLYKNTSAKNYIRKTASDSATSLGTIAANQKVYLNEMTYSGTYEGNTSAFGKVNVNGIVGWIICYGLYEIPNTNIISSTPTYKTIS